MSPDSSSSAENLKPSVSKRITRSLEAIRIVLQSDLGELRSSIAGILKQKGMEIEVPSFVAEPSEQLEPAFVKPTEKAPGMLDFRASKRQETGRTPRQVRDLVPISDDARKEDKALSEAFTEVFRRMAELVVIPSTNQVYAFMNQMFLHIRVRSDDLQAEKTFDQIFDEQIRWYCEEHFLSRRKVLSPAFAFHWDCYFQSPEAERYEDNLADHDNPE